MKAQTISKDMKIEEILKKYPGKAKKLAQIMTNTGLHCVGCGAAFYETLEEGALIHGMSKKEIDELVKKLNKALKKDKTKKKGITFTKFAAEKCKAFRKEPWHMFKISLNESSYGLTYKFKFKEKKEKGEIEFKDKGIRVLIDKANADKLNGIVIDYVAGSHNAGFKALR